MTTSTDRALALLGSMVLEDGRKWGAAAAPFQVECARTLLHPSAPPFRWESRPRGGSKTSDVAGVALAMMLTALAPGSTVDAYAADKDQARLLVDALRGWVQRTPGLSTQMQVDLYRVSTRTGVTLEVMAADAASAYGRRPSFTICDELCQWPSTSNARSLWEAIYSSLPKVPGSRLAVISTSGDPVHWSRKIRDGALGSPLWSVAEVPGPLSWIDSKQLEEQRRVLSESAFRRLHLNQWAASEDRLVRPDDLAACTVLSGPQDPRPGVQYCVGLDVGLRNDRTIASVCHSEPLEDGREGRRIVLDRQMAWQGSRVRPVSLDEVERWLKEASKRYNAARVVADPWQAVGLLQRLRSAGIGAEEFTFSAQSIGRLASEMMLALRDHRLALPDDPELLEELSRVRLRETSPGVLRMDHDPGDHDDRAISLGLAVLHLTTVGDNQGPVFVFGPDVRTRGLDGRLLARELPDGHALRASVVDATPFRAEGRGTRRFDLEKGPQIVPE